MNTTDSPTPVTSLNMTLPSAHQPGARVTAHGMTGTVERVCFTKSRVTYDVNLDEGTLPLQNVESSFVEPTNKFPEEQLEQIRKAGFVAAADALTH